MVALPTFIPISWFASNDAMERTDADPMVSEFLRWPLIPSRQPLILVSAIFLKTKAQAIDEKART
jgi:hypothetical protein